jgi:hypothetical protein
VVPINSSLLAITLSSSVITTLGYNDTHSVVPINSSLFTVTLYSSVITTQNIQSLSWRCDWVRLYFWTGGGGGEGCICFEELCVESRWKVRIWGPQVQTLRTSVMLNGTKLVLHCESVFWPPGCNRALPIVDFEAGRTVKLYCMSKRPFVTPSASKSFVNMNLCIMNKHVYNVGLWIRLPVIEFR